MKQLSLSFTSLLIQSGCVYYSVLFYWFIILDKCCGTVLVKGFLLSMITIKDGDIVIVVKTTFLIECVPLFFILNFIIE